MLPLSFRMVVFPCISYVENFLFVKHIHLISSHKQTLRLAVYFSLYASLQFAASVENCHALKIIGCVILRNNDQLFLFSAPIKKSVVVKITCYILRSIIVRRVAIYNTILLYVYIIV